MEKRLTEMEKRLGVVEDVEEIKQLHHQYINCVSRAEWDKIMDCFSEEPTTDFGGWDVIKGREAIFKQFKDGLSVAHIGREGNFIVHPIISVDGDKATGEWWMYQMWQYERTGQSLFWVQAVYDAEYVKEKEKWKISYLKWRSRVAPPGGPPPFLGT
jgi:hypothetical protein